MSNALDRLDELLVVRTVEALSEAENSELSKLLTAHPEIDPDAYDRTGAAIHAAYVELEPMPAHLHDRISRSAAELFDLQPDELAARRRKRSTRSRVTPYLPWLATAAAMVLVLITWWPNTAPQIDADIDSLRAALIAGGATRLDWTATADPAAPSASGDVVWDAQRQQGFMRFSMLAANEPTVFQYQLWIFDAERDERYPVDGGVFDIPANTGEFIVPIQAKLPIGDAVLFAVTVEQPGGVVVSDRERIVLLAELG